MTVSLAMLVKDPPLDRLAALLEYVRPIVSQAVVVVDDRTAPETLAVIGTLATVVPFTWIDDFAAARNAALPACNGDWILILDPDELPSLAMMAFVAAVDAVPWSEGCDHQGRYYPEAVGYLFATVGFDAGVRATTDERDWHVRLFRTDRGHFYKPVHEQVMLNDLPEPSTRGGPLCPKAPRGAYLIHSKPADRIDEDRALYRRIEEGVTA